MNKIIEAIKHPEKVIVALGRKTTLIPDNMYLRAYYKHIFGRRLNLRNPQTFNEKLQWLKLNDRNPLYTVMVDKYAAKNYVANIIGSEYIIPTYGVWDSFDEIDFDILPDQFVLKCTHDSAGIIIVKDKNSFNRTEAKKKMQVALKHDFYCGGREWPYKNVPHRILAEKYMVDNKKYEFQDCNFYCFGGTVKCRKDDFERFLEQRANFDDKKTILFNLGEVACPPFFEQEVEKTDNTGLMVELVKNLSKSTPSMRADFYDVDGKIYLGELTFYPAPGLDKGDLELEKWIQIPGGGILATTDLWVTFRRQENETSLTDYKIHCFNGKPEIILVCSDRFSKSGMKEDFYDTNWQKIDVKRPEHENSIFPIQKPDTLDTMLLLAEKLASDIPFVRVDFYTIGGRVYFGELTFYPASGLEQFDPPEIDLMFGKMLVL